MAIVKSITQINGQEVDIYIEVEREPPERSLFEDTRDSMGEKAAKAVGDLFGQGLALSRKCAAQVIESVQQMSDEIKPNEFEVQLAIKLDSEVGAVIAKATTGAQIQVTMKWTLKKTPQ